MGRSRRSPAQKAALARASQTALERRRNKLGLPPTQADGSSDHPIPNSTGQTNASPPTEDISRPKVDNSSPATERALKREELKLAREQERVAALERKLQDARLRESELREEIKALKERRPVE